MFFTISTSEKKELFRNIFQVLKKCSDNVNISFKTDFIFIQGMDSSHVCLYEIKLCDKWFNDTYECKEPTVISVNAGVIFNILSILISIEEEIIISIDDSDSTIVIATKSGSRQFGVPMCNTDSENELDIPEIEYDYEWSIISRELIKTMGELALFGENINIACTENEIILKASGVSGDMTAKINADDLESYETVEEIEQYNTRYSLKLLNKYCLSTNISKIVKVSMKKENPIKILYDMDNAYISFYLAPLIDDDDESPL